MKVAVVGVGALGRHHARILASLPGVELVAVADPNGVQARKIAEQHGCDWATDYRTLLDRVEAVSIAAPTFAQDAAPAAEAKPAAEAPATPAAAAADAKPAAAAPTAATAAPAAAATPAPVPNKGDTAWMLTATALVIMMTIPGLALFYGGMVRSKNMLSVLMQVFTCFSLLTVLWLPRGRVALTTDRLDRTPTSVRLGVCSALALAGMVVLMEHGHAPLGAAVLLVLFALGARASLRRMDWLLLLTFAAIFLGLGHFAELPWVRGALQTMDFNQPLTVYLGAIVASQAISNVPATVLLLDRAPDAVALAVAVNVGGFGLVTGSLANLIALRLARQPQGLRLLHAVSIPFLLVAAPLVYLAWRWLG